MMDQEEWLKLRSDIQDILDAYMVAINLSNDDKDRVSVITRLHTDHYISWAITKKVLLTSSSDYKFDVDCITVAIDIFDDHRMTISVDEKNCEIYMNDYPGLLMFEHRLSNPGAYSGEGLYIFKTKDIDLLTLIVATLDKKM